MKMYKLLIKYNASVTKDNSGDNNAISIAEAEQHFELADALREQLGKLNHTRVLSMTENESMSFSVGAKTAFK